MDTNTIKLHISLFKIIRQLLVHIALVQLSGKILQRKEIYFQW